MTCNNTCCNCSYDVHYQNFNSDKEYIVGEFFRIGKEVYKVILDEMEGCTNCEFQNVPTLCSKMICGYEMRYSEDSVVFILYDTLEENE